MKIKILLVFTMAIVFYIGCDFNMTYDDKNTEGEMSLEVINAINNGELFDPYGNHTFNEDIHNKVVMYLIENWKILESERVFAEMGLSSKKPDTEQHYSPSEHFSIWTFVGMYYIERPWENPPVMSCYKVWICFVSGCNVGTMEFIGDIPM